MRSVRWVPSEGGGCTKQARPRVHATWMLTAIARDTTCARGNVDAWTMAAAMIGRLVSSGHGRVGVWRRGSGATRADGARPTADVQRLRAMSRKDWQCVGNGVDVCRREGAMSVSYAADSTEVDSEANGEGGGQTGRSRLASVEMVLGMVMALCDDAPLSQSRVERGAGGRSSWGCDERRRSQTLRQSWGNRDCGLG
jgi:hypothetical protein